MGLASDGPLIRWAALNPAVGALLHVGCGDGSVCRLLAAVAAECNRGALICIDPFESSDAAWQAWDAMLRAVRLRQHVLQLRHPVGRALAFCRERGVRLRLAVVDGPWQEKAWELVVPGGLLLVPGRPLRVRPVAGPEGPAP